MQMRQKYTLDEVYNAIIDTEQSHFTKPECYRILDDVRI